MILPFTGNGDREQTIRAEKLEALGVLRVIHPEDLQPNIFAEQIIDYLQKIPTSVQIDLQGVEKPKAFLNELIMPKNVERFGEASNLSNRSLQQFSIG